MSLRAHVPAFLLITLVTARAAAPAWWSGRGATNGSPVNNSAAVNQGQLKLFTQKAVVELNAGIPEGAGSDLNDLVNAWVQEYQTGGYNAANPLPSDFSAINVGQLKWIAQQINACLVNSKYETFVPTWLTVNADSDNQLANLGQLKTVFNFDLSAPYPGGDSNGNGLADDWEKLYFGGLGTANPNAIQSGDGLTNKEKSDLGLNPNVNYLDNDPALATINQSAAVNSNQSTPKPSIFIYDKVDRLTDVTAKAGAASYTPDDEGNISNAH